jgi:hypothetical protein
LDEEIDISYYVIGFSKTNRSKIFTVYVWVNGVSENDSIQLLALSDITSKRLNKPIDEIVKKCEKLFEIVICKQKEEQKNRQKKMKERNAIKKKSPAPEKSSSSLIQNLNLSNDVTLLKEKIEKKKKKIKTVKEEFQKVNDEMKTLRNKLSTAENLNSALTKEVELHKEKVKDLKEDKDYYRKQIEKKK